MLLLLFCFVPPFANAVLSKSLGQSGGVSQDVWCGLGAHHVVPVVFRDSDPREPDQTCMKKFPNAGRPAKIVNTCG